MRVPRYCECWSSIYLGHTQAFRTLWKQEGLRHQTKLLPAERKGSVHLGLGLGPGHYNHYNPRPINGELDWPLQGPGMPGCWPSFRFQLDSTLGESVTAQNVGRVQARTYLRAGSLGVGCGWPGHLFLTLV